MTEIACPRCGRSLPYVEELADRMVFCLGCGAHYAIPRPAAPQHAESSEPPKLLLLDMPSESPTGDQSGQPDS